MYIVSNIKRINQTYIRQQQKNEENVKTLFLIIRLRQTYIRTKHGTQPSLFIPAFSIDMVHKHTVYRRMSSNEIHQIHKFKRKNEMLKLKDLKT